MYMRRMGSIWCNRPGYNRVYLMLGSGSEWADRQLCICFANNRDSFKGWRPKHQIDPIGPNTRTSKRMLWVCQWGCCDAKPLKVFSLGTTFMECVGIVCGQGLTSLNWCKLKSHNIYLRSLNGWPHFKLERLNFESSNNCNFQDL